MNRYRLGMVFVLATVLGCGVEDHDLFGGGLAGKAEDSVLDPVITQAMNGEYVEVPVLEEVKVQLQGTGWQCVSCDFDTVMPTEEDGSTFSFHFWPDDASVGSDFLLTFEQPSSKRYFAVTLSIEQDSARSDTFLDKACRLLDAMQTDPDAEVLLEAFRRRAFGTHCRLPASSAMPSMVVERRRRTALASSHQTVAHSENGSR